MVKGKKWVAFRIDKNLLSELEKMNPRAKDRTELFEKRLKNGGKPVGTRS